MLCRAKPSQRSQLMERTQVGASSEKSCLLIACHPGVHCPPAEVIEGIQPRDLEVAVQGRTLVAAHRKGKQLWFELDEGPALMIHLGEPGAADSIGAEQCCCLAGQHHMRLCKRKSWRRSSSAPDPSTAYNICCTLLPHAGMTGSIVVHGVKSVQYKSFVVGEDWPPRFCKLELQFEGGGKLALSDARSELHTC